MVEMLQLELFNYGSENLIGIGKLRWQDSARCSWEWRLQRCQQRSQKRKSKEKLTRESGEDTEEKSFLEVIMTHEWQTTVRDFDALDVLSQLYIFTHGCFEPYQEIADDGNHSGLSMTDVNIRNPLWSTISEIVRDAPWQASKIWEQPWVWKQQFGNHIYTPVQQMSNIYSCWTYMQTCPHSLLSTLYTLSSQKYIRTTYILLSINSCIIPFHPLSPSGPDLMALNISKGTFTICPFQDWKRDTASFSMDI